MLLENSDGYWDQQWLKRNRDDFAVEKILTTKIRYIS
jgi:hypothetical protein